MQRHRYGWSFSLLSAVLFMPPARAQQPPRPPALPAIVPNLARLDQTVGGLNGPGLAIAYNEVADILAAACEGNTIQYWGKGVMMGIRVGEGTPDILKGHDGPVTALTGRGGAILASAGADKKIILWSMPEGKVLHTLTAGGMVRALAMSPDGKVLAGGGDESFIQLWDVAAGQPGARLTGHTDWVLSLAFSSDGKQLASGGHDGAVRLWEVASGKKLRDIPAQPPAPPNTPPAPNIVLALAFSPDNTQLAIGGTDTNIHLANLADSKILRSIPGHAGSITSLAFHPSSTVLASGSKDRTVRLWTPANGQAIKSLEGHTAWVEGLTFFAQGTRLASVGADQTVRLWDLTNPQK